MLVSTIQWSESDTCTHIFPPSQASLPPHPSVWVSVMLSHVWLCATLWTIARPAPLSMGFSRQYFWSGFAISFSSDPTTLGHHKAPSWAPRATRQLPTSDPFYTGRCIYVNPNLPIHPFLPFHLCVHMLALYICISIPVLQIGSSVPFF